MLRPLTIAVSALALTAASASAQETRSMAGVIPGYEPSPFERNLADVETRMAEFGARMEALEDDEALTADQRRDRQAALWREFSPDILAFTTSAAEMGLATAGTMMESMNVGAVVAAALSQADLATAVASADVQAALAEAFAEIQAEWAAGTPEAAHDH